jgi:valyl-tRNA synthetase
MLSKEYSFKEVEEKWKDRWDYSIYHFQRESDKPAFVIDTPPPYPTGDFHIGNALNWFYIDFIARYKRMRGYNVMFPQGWDCHGLPTEVKVEERYGITKNEVPREKFRELCMELTLENIKKMKETMIRLGFSVDWSNEYITMRPEYFRKTQISFVRMYNRGYIYKDEHPVMYCPRCQTAIAQAEVEYEERETDLNYIKFDEEVVIATTRPELLAACVAVAIHPDDERYTDLIGKEIIVPIFGQKVKVISDEDVDPAFGTGTVMICTFGDRQDVRWWKRHNLPLRTVIDRNGKLNTLAGQYEGQSVKKCRDNIVEDLKRKGLLIRQEKIVQNVGLCWRCKTPIEIVAQRQWFVKVIGNEVLEAAEKIQWIPEHMKIRLKNWVEAMEWDWCISRQRVFATPIPVWYCKKCGQVMVAEEEWLPVDPLKDSPKKPCVCGSNEFEGESDVLDTWMDSSITSLAITGWPDDLRGYPTQLRPQGHDIIRTWAFYTILRSLALVEQIPWHSIVINGMVLGEDGRKMSKSLGNIISPEEVVERYGADALRQWAAIGGVVGSDVQFSWKEVVSASRFMQKFWSVVRFSINHLMDYIPSHKDIENLKTTDKWILSLLNKLIERVTVYMEEYRFDEALKEIRSFLWDEFADNYIELVKGRLYRDKDRGAKYTLKKVVEALIIMYAPFAPFMAEEMYHIVNNKSVHTEQWPSPDKEMIDESAERDGELIKEIVSSIRRLKHEKGLPLNAPLKNITIVSRNDFDVIDIADATSSPVRIVEGVPEIREVVSEVKPILKEIGPRFREKARTVIDALSTLNEEDAKKLERDGYLNISLDGDMVTVERDWVEIVKNIVSEGRKVELIHIGDITVMVEV